MAPTGTTTLFQYGTGHKSKGIDENGVRCLNQPRGLHVLEDGGLLVADYGNHCVMRFKADDKKGRIAAGEEGKCLETVDPLKDIDRPTMAPDGEGRKLKRPVHACVDSEGGVYVLDADAARVQRFDASGPCGLAPTVIPAPGGPPNKSAHAPEAVKFPRSMLVSSDGSLVICDTWSHRIVRYNKPGSPEASDKPIILAGMSNSAGIEPEKLNFPSAIAFDASGRLLVCDTNNHRVQRFEAGSTSGTTVAGSASGEEGSERSQMNMPTGLCVDSKGDIYVADRANSRVLRFPSDSKAGAAGEVVVDSTLVESPWGLCLGADGALYVSDEKRAVVLKLEVGAAAPAGAPASPDYYPPEMD